MREHLRQAGRAVADPEPPEGGEHLLRWFWVLDSGRSFGFGPNPISFQDIAAWTHLTGAAPEPWEIRALKAMDNAYLTELAQRTRNA